MDLQGPIALSRQMEGLREEGRPHLGDRGEPWVGPFPAPNQPRARTNIDGSGSREILEEYWKSRGGRPASDQKPPPKKRGRQSTGGKKPDTQKKPKISKPSRKSGGGRKSNGAIEQDTSPIPLIGYTDEGDDDWHPPPPKDGAWDPLVQSVDTVTRENSDGELWGWVIFNEKNEDGRFYRRKAKLPVIYRACPQRVRSPNLSFVGRRF